MRSLQSAPHGRNDLCPCGSGRKFKRCCGGSQAAKVTTREAQPDQRAPGLSAEGYVRLAERLTQTGNLRGAIDALEKSVLLQPRHPAAHFNLALACLNAGMLARAVAGFRQAIALRPSFAQAYFCLGLALEQLGEDWDAIIAFRGAVRIAPKMAEAYNRLGYLLRGRGLRAEAIEAYKQVTAISPDTTLGRLNLARALIEERRSTEAEVCLRRAIALDPHSSALHWLLATLLGEAGRFDEAEPLFRRTIELDPDRVAVYYDYLLSKRLTEADRPILARMENLLDRPTLAEPQRVRLLFALAKGFDDVEDHAAAIRYFDQANSLCRRSLVFDRAGHARLIDRIIQTFTPSFLAMNANLAADDDRAILILGMPRSGTTLIEQIISSHSRIAAGGELHFWVDRAEKLRATNLAESAVETAGELASGFCAELDRISCDAARVTDKNPYNFLWIGLIRLIFPNARIIHCQRNPIDTCLSIYTTHFGVRTSYASDRGDLVFYYCQYLRLMQHWRDILPPGVMMDVSYEDVIADPERWSRALIDFCGLDWDPACLHPEDNIRTVATASLWQARQPIYRSSVERWRNYEPWLGELAALHSGAG